MTKKSKATLEKSKRFSNRQLIAVSVIVISVFIISGSVLSLWLMQTPEVKFSLKAVIIDQLGKEEGFFNASFVNSATDILKSSGFNVTYYNQTIDVNFYRSLAKSDYGIIILRAHTALREDNSTVDIFTSEQFVNGRYQSELENELVTRGEFLYKPGEYFFAITYKFINNLEGRFPKSIIIAMGCSSLKPDLKPEPDKLAKAFINKGAAAYIGWTNLVAAPDTDAETIKLMKSLLVENGTLSNAVSRTSSHAYIADGQSFTSRLRSYPSGADDLKISTLVDEAKAALTFPNSPHVLVNSTGAERSLRRRMVLSQTPCLLESVETER